MKTINAISLLFITSVLIACGGAEERKAAYMDRAEKSMSAGDLDKARIELKNVLQIDPKDSAAYFMLGKILENKKEYNKAFQNYTAASELAPENLEYMAKIGQFHLILARDIDKATEILNKIKSKDANNIDGQLLDASIKLKQNKTDEAMAIALRIYEAHPDNIDNGVLLVAVYNSEKKYEKSIKVLDKVISHNPGNVSLLSLLANSLYANKDYERTEEILKEIKDKHPEVFSNHMQLAVFYQKRDRLKDARSILDTAVESQPDELDRKMVLIDFIRQTQSTEEAIKETQRLIQGSPLMGGLRLALGELQIATNDYVNAKATYINAIKDFPDDETGIKSRITLASIYMRDNDVDSATKTISDALKISPNDAGVNYLKAKMAFAAKNYDQAIISLRIVTKDDPENMDAYFLLAGSHNAIKESEQANQVIVRAYENNRTNLKALLQLAHYHISISNNIAEAEKIIDEYLMMDGNSYDALAIKANILNRSKRYDDAYAVANQLVKSYPSNEQGYIQSAPYLLNNKKNEEAINILKTGYDKTRNINIFKMLADVQISSGHAKDAIASLTKKLDEDKDESIYIFLAKAYLANGEKDKSIQALTDSIRNNPNGSQSYAILAKLLLQQGDNAKAITLLKDGVKANSDSLDLTLLLAGAHEKNKEYDAAIALYEGILIKHGDNNLIINNLAALLSEYKHDQDSLDRAIALADKLKDVKQPAMMDTVGWVYFKTGKITNAVEILQRAVDANPEISVFNYHLGMAYHKLGDNDKARTYLQKALSKDAQYPGVEQARETLKLL